MFVPADHVCFATTQKLCFAQALSTLFDALLFPFKSCRPFHEFRPASTDHGQQAVKEDCCAWELLQLFYLFALRYEGSVTQVKSLSDLKRLCTKILRWKELH